MTHKFRWPPSAALQEILTHSDEIESMYIAVRYKNGETGVVASGMSETSAMRVALKFLLGEEQVSDKIMSCLKDTGCTDECCK